MGAHPINLALRFLLEICVLAVAGYWGWKVSDGSLRFVLVWLVPLALAGVWGTFAVPDDPSRSGHAPIPVPGIVRLAVELAVFSFGVWALYSLGHPVPGVILGVLVVVHYSLSYDRITWLVRQ